MRVSCAASKPSTIGNWGKPGSATSHRPLADQKPSPTPPGGNATQKKWERWVGFTNSKPPWFESCHATKMFAQNAILIFRPRPRSSPSLNHFRPFLTRILLLAVLIPNLLGFLHRFARHNLPQQKSRGAWYHQNIYVRFVRNPFSSLLSDPSKISVLECFLVILRSSQNFRALSRYSNLQFLSRR